MRFLVYNIAYGTGTAGGVAGVFGAHRYLRTPETYLDSIIGFINGSGADVVGLVEVDTGSFRTGFVNQAGLLASRMRGYSRCAVKYAKHSIGRLLPILRKQGNAFFSRRGDFRSQAYYMPFGFKRLILELDLDGIRFFLVHLALSRNMRERQLEYLKKIAAINPEPMIVAGDFNAFSGAGELDLFMRELNLYDPNSDAMPTFPSQAPKHRLDFILCSKGIRTLAFSVPDVKYSDHLPLILDFEPA